MTEDEQVKKDLQSIAKYIDSRIPYHWGFVLLAFPFGTDGTMNYVSNANRADIVRTMYEFIETTKEKWGEDILDSSSAAEDEQIARLRQRVAELERKLEYARIKT